MKDEDIIDTANKWREQERADEAARWAMVLRAITTLGVLTMLLGFTAWAVPACSGHQQVKKAAKVEAERAFVQRREDERKRREIAWVETCQVVERRGQELVFRKKAGWGFTEIVNDGDAP